MSIRSFSTDMKRFFTRYEFLLVFAGAICLTVVLFNKLFFQQKILFPANLLVSSYAPWKYEPDPQFPNGPPNKPTGFDNIRQFFPNRKLLQESLVRGIIPLWNPYIYSGTPFLAAFDTAVLYPLSWFAALLPAIRGWDFLVIIAPLLSLLFMYLFLSSLKFDRTIRVFGAVAWALSGWMAVYWQEILVVSHSFLWLPLALYASNKLWNNRHDRVGFGLLVLALTSSLFAGFFQMTVYVYMVVVAWNLQKNEVWKTILWAMVISLLLSSVQLFPTIETYLSSPRGLADGFEVFRDRLLPLTHLITFLAPDFWGNPATYNYFGGNGFYFEKMIFIGIIPLVFAFYGAVKENRKARFWIIVAAVALSMGFSLPTSWLPYWLRIPILSNSYPTRIFAVSGFSLVVLACYGLASFLKRPDKKVLSIILILLSIGLAVGWSIVIGAWYRLNHCPGGAFWCMGTFGSLWNTIAQIPDVFKDASWYVAVSSRNLLLPTAILLTSWVLLILPRKLYVLLAFVLTVLSSFYFVVKYLSYSDQKYVYPDLPVISKISELAGFDRIWGYGHAFIEKNLPQYYRWFSTDGYGNLSSGRYAQLLGTIVQNGKLGGTIRRSDTDMFEASEWDSMDANPYRLRMMSLLGVKYVIESKRGELKEKITTEKRFPDSLFELVWQNDAWRIWQYRNALPRAVFATEVVIIPDDQPLIEAMYDPNIDFGRVVLLEEDPGISTNKSGNGKVAITQYGLNSVTLETHSDTAGIVVLSDNYAPGWMATIDGQKAKVYRVNYSFRGIPVSSGSHTVVLTYVPFSFVAGAVVSILGVMYLSYVLAFNLKNKVNRN